MLIIFLPKYSWADFIYTRCQNVNRKTKSSGPSDEMPSTPSKKSKIDPEKHSYPPLSLDVEDEVSLQRNMTLLQQELSKPKPHFDSVASLMYRTFPQRRQWILNNTERVGDIIEKYPFLSKSVYVRCLKSYSLIIFSSTFPYAGVP